MEMREALTDENQTSNFVVSFATAVIKNSRNFFLQLCGFSCFLIDLWESQRLQPVFKSSLSQSSLTFELAVS